jgi:hypothetical protein
VLSDGEDRVLVLVKVGDAIVVYREFEGILVIIIAFFFRSHNHVSVDIGRIYLLKRIVGIEEFGRAVHIGVPDRGGGGKNRLEWSVDGLEVKEAEEPHKDAPRPARRSLLHQSASCHQALSIDNYLWRGKQLS